jgi:hypothetical protein
LRNAVLNDASIETFGHPGLPLPEVVQLDDFFLASNTFQNHLIETYAVVRAAHREGSSIRLEISAREAVPVYIGACTSLTRDRSMRTPPLRALALERRWVERGRRIKVHATVADIESDHVLIAQDEGMTKLHRATVELSPSVAPNFPDAARLPVLTSIPAIQYVNPKLLPVR